MSVLLIAAALAGAAATGYTAGRTRPAQRISDWAEWEKYSHPTGLRRAAVFTVLSITNLAWIVAHPRQARDAWKHRNDPPPPLSPAVRIPRVRRDAAAQEGPQKP